MVSKQYTPMTAMKRLQSLLWRVGPRGVDTVLPLGRCLGFAVPAAWAKYGTSGQSVGLWQSSDPLGLRWYRFAKHLPFGCTTWGTEFLLTAHTLLGQLLHSLAASSSSSVGLPFPISQPQFALVESQTGCLGWWLHSLAHQQSFREIQVYSGEVFVGGL